MGDPDRYLATDQVYQIVNAGVEALGLRGQRVLIIIPDGTRSMPMPLMFRVFQEVLAPQVRALDFLVALGTHSPMSDAQLSRLVGETVVDGVVGQTCIFNHRWDDPETFVTLGVIPADEIK